jgi:hypothetical protein
MIETAMSLVRRSLPGDECHLGTVALETACGDFLYPFGMLGL